MSGSTSRLRGILSHLGSGTANSAAKSPTGFDHSHHIHQLSPTYFLERAAAIEPDALAIHHITVNGKVLRRPYCEFADRARGLAYYLLKHGYKRVGILATNTPAFLESIFGIVAAGAVIVPTNYRLKPEDITYIFDFADVDSIIVDNEYLSLLDDFRKSHPNVPFIVDLDTDATEGELSGPFDEAVLEGLKHDQAQGSKGWSGLHSHSTHEDDMIAIPFTSGTTSRPKGCVFTHRGSYLSALGNVIESGLNIDNGRCKYLWTLPMFHAVGWTYPWAVTATNLNLHPVHVYGLTETYGPITKGYYLPHWDSLPDSEKYAKMARQGYGFVTSLPIRVIKTDQPEGVFVDVAKDGKEIGEIILFGNMCIKGYYKDAEATRKLFAGGGLHTGDLAVWHPDGSAQIQDRAKDIIIRGENISSVALEGMLVQHPDVLEAGVVAVPDSHWGERPKAYLTVKEGKTLRPQDMINWCRENSSISKFMIPREVEIVLELPKTGTGKIKKNVLREWAKTGRAKLGN
ncbi:hypothetical protein ABKA04_001072 [Annulohypoxylon sp. FPYF3050]